MNKFHTSPVVGCHVAKIKQQYTDTTVYRFCWMHRDGTQSEVRKMLDNYTLRYVQVPEVKVVVLMLQDDVPANVVAMTLPFLEGLLS